MNETTLKNLIFIVLALFAQVAFAATAPVVQIYYLPVSELDSRSFYLENSPLVNGVDPDTDMILTVSIVTGAANGIITIDHWEDGYEADISTPLQSTTQIYGDGNLTNGIAPSYPTDILPRGATVNTDSDIDPDDRATDIDLDGQDKIASSVPIAVSLLTYPETINNGNTTGTVMADATELLSTISWGTDFTIPVDHTSPSNRSGEDSSLSNIGVAIIAQEDDTTVEIDGIGATANGTADITQNLNEGGTYVYIDTSDNDLDISDNLFIGSKIHSDKPIQIIFLTARREGAYESRWYYLYPDNLLNNNYYNPVATTGDVGTSSSQNNPTAVFIHNINNSSINIRWTRSDGTTTTTTDTPVAAHTTTQFNITDQFGSRFYSLGSENFSAIALVDADASSTTRDWGFTLIPEGQLRQQGIVGLGIGSETGAVADNSSPVFLMATYPSSSASTGAITVCVDFNGDSAGPLTDGNGVDYDVQFVLNPLRSVKVYDPDGDQSAMFLYVCDGSDGIIATAWGEFRYEYGDGTCDINGTYGGNCSDAATSGPAIDAGTAVPGFPSAVASKSFTLTNDLDGDGFTDLGETITYSIKVDQAGNLPVPAGAFTVFDDLPPQVTYVPGSTVFIDTTNTSSPIADNGVGTAFPIDELGYPLPTSIGIGESVYFNFDVVVTSIPPNNQPIINRASLSGSEEFTTENPLIVPGTIGDRIYFDANNSGGFDAGEGISGVTLTLVDDSNPTTIIGTTTTGADGIYLFNGLPPETYRVVIDAANFNSGNPLNSYITQIDPDANAADQIVVELDMDEDHLTADYAYEPVGSLTGTIFKDFDNGSDIDIGEGTQSVTVELLDSMNVVIATTSTNASGVFTFTNVPVGNYTVRVASSSFGVGQPLENFANTYDVDGGFDSQISTSVTLGNTTSGLDLGYQSNASVGSISGNVFKDNNINGNFDGGEGTNAVVVELLIGTTVVDTTTTDSSGAFTFNSLAAGNYTVRVAGSNFNVSQPLNGFGQNVDPDGTKDNQTNVTLATAQDLNAGNFGYIPSASQCRDLSPIQLNLDGVAFTLSKQVNPAIRIRDRLSSRRTCSALSNSTKANRRSSANSLYVQAWQTTYSMPQTDYVQCIGSNCATVDVTPRKATYLNFVNQIANISKNLLSPRCVRNNAGRNRTKLLAGIQNLLSEANTLLASYPDTPLVCN